MEKMIKMSLEDFSRYSNDTDPSLAIADACFLSTRPNSHGFIITEEVLRRDAHTILGKFLTGNMDFFGRDTLGHEPKPQIFGYFPTDQEIRFVEKDGYVLAYAYAVMKYKYGEVSYLYVPKTYENDEFYGIVDEWIDTFERERL